MDSVLYIIWPILKTGGDWFPNMSQSENKRQLSGVYSQSNN